MLEMFVCIHELPLENIFPSGSLTSPVVVSLIPTETRAPRFMLRTPVNYFGDSECVLAKSRRVSR